MTDEGPSGAAYLRLVLLAAAIGVPAALVAALFLAAVHGIEDWLWDDPAWYLIVGLPVVGACVVIAARTLLPGDGGHSPLGGLSTAPTPLAHAPGVALAALGTLCFGAVLGPEAPLIALGSAVGLSLTLFVKLAPKESALMSGAGSFAAISALFGGPLVGGVLMVEAGAAGLGAALLPALLPGFVAAAVGYLIFVGFGDWGGLDAPGLAVPHLPAYDGTHPGDLLVALVVGVTAALTIAAVRRLAEGVARTPRLGMPGLLLAGGLAVGALAEVADLLGASWQDELFSGQSAVPALIAEDSTSIVLVMIVAKALAYAVSLGCGFRGGPVFPAIFLGIGLATLPVVWFDVSPTLAVAVGAAAGMAATTRLLLTPMLFAALLAGSPGLDAVPAAVLAAAAAWLAVQALDRRPPRESAPRRSWRRSAPAG
jgi:chloride channel protein, CIC family